MTILLIFYWELWEFAVTWELMYLSYQIFQLINLRHISLLASHSLISIFAIGYNSILACKSWAGCVRFTSSYFKFLSDYFLFQNLCVCTCATECSWRSQGKLWRSKGQFSLSTLWVPAIEFNCQAQQQTCFLSEAAWGSCIYFLNYGIHVLLVYRNISFMWHEVYSIWGCSSFIRLLLNLGCH